MDVYDGPVLDGTEYRKFRITWDSSTLKVERFVSDAWQTMMQTPHSHETSQYSIERAMVQTEYSVGYWYALESSAQQPTQSPTLSPTLSPTPSPTSAPVAHL